MNFNWQTDEADEERWEQEQQRRTAGAAPRRRRWLVLSLTLLLAAAAIFFLYREGRQQVEESTARLEVDVVASHRLAEQAVQERDLELFSTLLSGREPAWTEAQKERLEAGVLYGEAGRILGLEPLSGEAPVVDVSFSSDLREATVTTLYPYLLPGQAVRRTITLTHTAVYRKGNNSWLLAPPEAENAYWGNRRTRERNSLTLTYPQRDETLALKLARDLEGKVGEMCSQVGCPSDYHVRVRFSPDPESVLPLLDPEEALAGWRTLVLPAPSLVGVPATDADYEAYFQGYARRLLLPLLVERQEWACCRQVLFHQALLYRQLTALAVLPEAVTDVDYFAFPDEWPDRDQLRAWWREDEPAAGPEAVPPGVYAALDFLLERQIGTLFNLQAPLQGALRQWLVEEEGTVSQGEWVDFIQARIAERQQQLSMPAGLAWPGQALIMACQSLTVETQPRRPESSLIVHYDPATEQWMEEQAWDTDSVMMAILPDDNGYFLSKQRLAQGEEPSLIETTLFRPGQAPVPVTGREGEASEVVVWPLSDPAGERMMAFFVNRGSEGGTSFKLFDPETCTEAGCRFESLPGFPAWSPGGGQMLAMSFNQEQIWYKAEGTPEWEEIGRGRIPFWLDEQTFGFVDGSRPGERSRVLLGIVGGAEPEPWLTEATLSAALPEARTPFSLEINGAFGHPLSSDHFLLLTSTNSQESDLFLVGKEPGETWLAEEPEVRHLETLPASPVGLPVMAGMVQPGRPWLVIPLAGQGAGLWLYNLASEEVVMSTAQGPGFYQQSFDWSADGVWLARPAGGAIDLIAPDYRVDGRPYRHFLFHDYGACTAVGWLDRE